MLVLILDLAFFHFTRNALVEGLSIKLGQGGMGSEASLWTYVLRLNESCNTKSSEKQCIRRDERKSEREESPTKHWGERSSLCPKLVPSTSPLASGLRRREKSWEEVVFARVSLPQLRDPLLPQIP